MIRSSRMPPADARVALLVTLAATIAVVLTPTGRWIDHALYAAALLLSAILLRVPPRPVIRRLIHTLPLVLIIVISVGLSIPGETVWRFGEHLTATREGLTLAGSIACKVALAVSLLACLGAVHTPTRILAALRGLGCPAMVVAILGTMQRQIQVIGQEWRRMRRASQSRSPRAHQPAKALRVHSRLAAMLLVRSLDRSERVHRAMLARGGAELITLPSTGPLAAHDWIALAFGLCAVAALRILAVLLA